MTASLAAASRLLGPGREWTRFGLRRRMAAPGLEMRHYVFPPGHRVPRHTHQQPSLVLMFSGAFRGSFAEEEFQGARGEIVAVPPGRAHSEMIGPRGAESLIIQWTGELDREMPERLFERHATHTGTAAHRWVRRVRLELARFDSVSPLVLEASALGLLAHRSAIHV